MPKESTLRHIARPALFHVGVVFALAFCLGAMRVTWIAPKLGAVRAVLVEVPLVLAISWITAGAALRRWPLRTRGDRAVMGAMAFVVLMALELALGGFGFGRSLTEMLREMGTPAGLIGLAGQIGFGLIPLVRQPSG